MNYIAIPGLKVRDSHYKPNLLVKSSPERAEQIMEVVSDFYGLTVQQMVTKSSKRELVIARQVSAYFILKYTSVTLQHLGKMMGGQNHTTAIHSRKTVQDLMDTDPIFKEEVQSIKEKL